MQIEGLTEHQVELLEKDGYPDANKVIDQFRLTK